MTDLERSLTDLHASLGYRRLSPTWAKLEILFGLSAAGVGLWGLTRPEGHVVGACLALFVLGGYLALAGHRSHLYRSMNDRTAYLAARLDSLQDKHKPDALARDTE
jgi:hypothetical protein